MHAGQFEDAPMAAAARLSTMACMLDVNALKTADLKGLSKGAVTEIAAALLAQLAAQQAAITAKDEHIARRDREIKFKDAKIERITFELARLKAWKFGAKTEAMNAEQRQMFEDTLAEDQASLDEQLRALQGVPDTDKQGRTKRKPRRQALPAHLRRVEHRHEPADTSCPTPGCGEPMVRIGEDVSERLDIVPAEFFVHRHIRGKWACKCCQAKGEGRLVQEPVAPQIIDKGLPASGLLAHTLVARFVDHLPYYRQQQINARSGVHTPRSTLAAWAGAAGASLMPLYDAHRAFVLSARVLHADETPVRVLDPGAGKTAKAYVWAYARGEHDATPGVIYEFCAGRGSKYPAEFLAEWAGTLTCDDYGGYDVVFKREGNIEAGCLAHARRKFDELAKANASPVAAQAIQRIARLYRVEAEAREMTGEERLAHRQQHAQPLWNELHTWLGLERARVPDGGGIAGALDYSLKRWKALGRFLLDGAVSIDNNHIENLVRPWAMGRKAWLFAGSELAGQRAAMVMSLVQSAKLHGHDPWAYLKDVLDRLLEHPNHRLDELLPHRWQGRQASATAA
jgi:transposase